LRRIRIILEHCLWILNLRWSANSVNRCKGANIVTVLNSLLKDELDQPKRVLGT
jgi:hypothetical protein